MSRRERDTNPALAPASLLALVPLAAWPCAIACDAIAAATGDLLWAVLGFYAMGVGVIAALAAAEPSSDAPLGRRASGRARPAASRMAHALAVALFLVTWLVRWPALRPPSDLALDLEAAAGCALLVGVAVEWLEPPVDARRSAGHPDVGAAARLGR